MQRRMKTLVFTLLLIVGYNVQAAKNFDVAVADNQILMVELEDAQEGDLLTLLDVEGKVLFKDAHLNNKFQKSLSLELVPDGTYFLHLEDENSIYAKEIEKKNNTITVKRDSQIFFKPNFKQIDKQVKVSFTNPDQKNIQVYVFDANGEVVTNIVNNDLVLKKTFDFSAVPAGDYMLAVFSGDRSYYRTVSTK
mgnify:CR=1 FL=1